MLNIFFAAIALIIALGASKFAGYARASGEPIHKHSFIVGLAIAAMVYFLYPLIDPDMIDLRLYNW